MYVECVVRCKVVGLNSPKLVEKSKLLTSRPDGQKGGNERVCIAFRINLNNIKSEAR